MLHQSSLIVRLVMLVDFIPLPPQPLKRKRGRQKYYSDRLILKALIVMIIRRLHSAYALHQFRLNMGERQLLIAHLFALVAVCGTRKIEKGARFRTLLLIQKRDGVKTAGTAGGMDGNSTSL